MYLTMKKNPKTFWKQFKLLKGNQNINTPYLLEKDGDKKFKDEEKCKILEDIWKDTLRITEDEDQQFCRVNSDMVEDFIRHNTERIYHHNTIDLSRLDNNFLTRDISTGDIKRCTSRLKDNSPGQKNFK